MTDEMTAPNPTVTVKMRENGPLLVKGPIELLDHVPLGRSLGEVGAHLDDERAHRRIVELVP